MKISQNLMKFNENQWKFDEISWTSVKIWWNLMKINENLMKFHENQSKFHQILWKSVKIWWNLMKIWWKITFFKKCLGFGWKLYHLVANFIKIFWYRPKITKSSYKQLFKEKIFQKISYNFLKFFSKIVSKGASIRLRSGSGAKRRSRNGAEWDPFTVNYLVSGSQL